MKNGFVVLLYRLFLYPLILFRDFDDRVDVRFPGPFRICIRFGSLLVILIFVEFIAWLVIFLTHLIYLLCCFVYRFVICLMENGVQFTANESRDPQPPGNQTQ